MVKLVASHPTFDSPYMLRFDKRFTTELNGEICVKNKPFSNRIISITVSHGQDKKNITLIYKKYDYAYCYSY